MKKSPGLSFFILHPLSFILYPGKVCPSRAGAEELMPLPSRRLFAFALLAAAIGAGAAVLVYAYHSRTREPTPPRPPPPASAEEVREFCGACHAYPPPETLPREAWRKEVLQGFRFAGEAGR